MRQSDLLNFFLLASFYLTGCLSRTFSDTASERIADPDTPTAPCQEVLHPQAPYTPEMLSHRLTAAMNQAARSKTFEAENFRDLLYSDEIETAARGELKPDIFMLDSCALTRKINESMTKPVHMYWLTGNGRNSFGGMAIYRGDVFAEGFYRNRSSGVQAGAFARKRYDLDGLLNEQPWFEWNAQSKTFTARIGTPGPRLLSHITKDQSGNPLTLYRGTNVKFADKSAALATMNSFAFGKGIGGIFSTPSYKNAKSWSNPVVLTSRPDATKLMEAVSPVPNKKSSKGRVFAGIEFEYVEIAFLYEPGDKNNLFFDNVVEKCVDSEKSQGADLNYAPPCK